MLLARLSYVLVILAVHYAHGKIVIGEQSYSSSKECSLSKNPFDQQHRHSPPKGPSDPTFLKDLDEWRELLIGGVRRTYQDIRQLPGEQPFRIHGKPKLVWPGPRCSAVFKKGQLRIAATIHRHRNDPDGNNKVYLAVDKVTNKRYAFKVFAKVDEFEAEKGFLSIADHPNIAKPVCWTGGERPGLMTEWVEGGVKSGRWARKQQSFDPLRTITAQVLSVVIYTHWLGYLHSDLKPDNILIDAKGNAVVVDWGFAERVEEAIPHRGTPSTYPPEKAGVVVVDDVNGELVTSSESDGSWQAALHEGADFWSLAMTVLGWCGSLVLESVGSPDRYHPIRRRREDGRYEFEKCSMVIPEQFRSFAHILTAPNPLDRRLVTERQLDFIQSHPLFDGIDWSELGPVF